MFLSTWGPSIPGNPDGPSGPGGPGGPLGPGINLGSTSLQWWECYAESQTIFVWLDIEAQKRFLTAACWWRGGRGVQPRDARRTRWTWEIIAEAEEKRFSKQILTFYQVCSVSMTIGQQVFLRLEWCDSGWWWWLLKADGVLTVTWPMKADVSIDILGGPMTATNRTKPIKQEKWNIKSNNQRRTDTS